jgi:hypothetical protein
VFLIDAKASIGVDGWNLNFAFLIDITTYVGMTNFMVALEIPHRIFDLDTNQWGFSPMSQHGSFTWDITWRWG